MQKTTEEIQNRKDPLVKGYDFMVGESIIDMIDNFGHVGSENFELISDSLTKALSPEEFQKARGRSHLVQKTITDKRGRKRKVWVKPKKGDGLTLVKEDKPKPKKTRKSNFAKKAEEMSLSELKQAKENLVHSPVLNNKQKEKMSAEATEIIAEKEAKLANFKGRKSNFVKENMGKNLAGLEKVKDRVNNAPMLSTAKRKKMLEEVDMLISIEQGKGDVKEKKKSANIEKMIKELSVTDIEKQAEKMTTEEVKKLHKEAKKLKDSNKLSGSEENRLYRIEYTLEKLSNNFENNSNQILGRFESYIKSSNASDEEKNSAKVKFKKDLRKLKTLPVAEAEEKMYQLLSDSRDSIQSVSKKSR